MNRYRGLSDPLKTHRRVELVLGVLGLLFVLQLLLGALSWVFPSAESPIFPAGDSLTVTSATGAALADAAQRQEIEQRPVFWEARRPPQSAPVVDQEDGAAAQELQPENIDGIQLAGIFGAGDTTGIIVIAKGKKHRLTIGEEVNGWKLVAAQPTEAVFSSLGKQATLSLKKSSIAVPETASPAAGGKADLAAGRSAGASGAKNTGRSTNKSTGRSAAKPAEKSAAPTPSAADDSLSLGGGNR